MAPAHSFVFVLAVTTCLVVEVLEEGDCVEREVTPLQGLTSCQLLHCADQLSRNSK